MLDSFKQSSLFWQFVRRKIFQTGIIFWGRLGTFLNTPLEQLYWQILDKAENTFQIQTV